jgi:hypothetical protein
MALNRLNVKEWQSYHIKNDDFFGNVTASILQYIYKNKYASLIALSKSIKKNPSIILPGDGVAGLLLKMKNLIDIMPKFFITNYFQSKAEDSSPDFIYTVKCDFIIKLKFDMFNEIPDKYIESATDAFRMLEANNKKIILKYLTKEALSGSCGYFVSKDFLEKEIFEAKIYSADENTSGVMKKFNLTKYAALDDLINVSNFNEETKSVEDNIKIIGVPFTPAKMNGYFSIRAQKILHDRYGAGKDGINIKLLFLNSEVFLKNEGETVFEALAEKLYDEYFNEKIGSIKKEKSVKEEADFSFENIFQSKEEEASSKHKDNIISDEHFNVHLEENIGEELSNRAGRKELILNILMREKIPSSEINLLRNISADKLKVKKVFSETLDILCTPFLSQIINTGRLKFLKTFIISNYGESLRENINEETSRETEEKFLNYLKSSSCGFIERFNGIIKLISEETAGKEYITENILKNSFIFNNLVFKKYIQKPKEAAGNKRINAMALINNEFNIFMDTGTQEELYIIPYIKIKELMVYLCSGNINRGWEKLAALFESFLPVLNSSIYKADFDNGLVSLSSAAPGNFELYIKKGADGKSFVIKKPEDIEYILKDKELEEIKKAVAELFKLHNKRGFGFTDKNDFLKFIALYNKRSGQYYYYKDKTEAFEKSLLNAGFISTIIKKIIYWFSASIAEHNLYKIKEEDREFAGKIIYSYTEKKGSVNKNNLAEVKEKITGDIDNVKRREKLEALRSKGGGEIGSYRDMKIQKETVFKKDAVKKKELEPEEEKLYSRLSFLLSGDKDAVFLHYPEKEDEAVIIYIKDRVEDKMPLFQKVEWQDSIKEAEQVKTRYYLIKNLAKKGYLTLKSSTSSGNSQKQYYLFIN